MYTLQRRFCPILALLILWSAPLTSSAVVCGLRLIRGFESEYSNAQQVLGSGTTSTIDGLQIYLTCEEKNGNRYIYAHSNFKDEGAPYPIKLAEPVGTFDSIIQVIGNLVYEDANSYRADSLGTKAKLSKIKLFATPDFFSATGDPLVNLSGVSSVVLIEAGPKKVTLVPNHTRGPPPFLAMLSANTRAKYTPAHSPTLVANGLVKARFSKEDFSLLNLIEETPVEEAVDALGLAERTVQIKGKLTEESLLRLIEQHRGKCLAALFHCDGSNLQVVSPSGDVILNMPLEKVSAAARKADCAFIGLGCSSSHANIGIGAMETFDPVKALESMQRALVAKNFADFSEQLAGGNFRLVFDPAVIESAFFFRGYPISNNDGRRTISKLPALAGVMVPRSE